MVGFSLSLALLAIVMCLVLFFAYAGLLEKIRELQDLVLGGTGQERILDGLAGSSPAVLIVTEDRCLSCRERLPEFELLAIKFAANLRFFGINIGGIEVAPDEVSNVVWISDPDVLSTLGVGATPSVVAFDNTGRETGRAIAGSTEDLEDFVAWAAGQDSARRNEENQEAIG